MKKSSIADLQQPSSRDASGEDAAEDQVAQPPTNTKHKKSATSIDAANPPAKRPRTRSSTAGENGASNGMPVPSISKEDEGEPSETTEASEDIATRSKRKGKSLSSKGQVEGKHEQDSEAMPPPGKGGLQEPVGYHTNPPPKGRAVRIYADGVFDLFHLGYVSSSLLLSTQLTVCEDTCASLNKRRMLSRILISWLE